MFSLLGCDTVGGALLADSVYSHIPVGSLRYERITVRYGTELFFRGKNKAGLVLKNYLPMHDFTSKRHIIIPQPGERAAFWTRLIVYLMYLMRETKRLLLSIKGIKLLWL